MTIGAGKRGRCALCERHQKLETMDGTAFWMEQDEADRTRLVMDSRTRGGGLNVLCVHFCPVCGRFCDNDDEQEENHEPEEQSADLLRAEHREADTTKFSQR